MLLVGYHGWSGRSWLDWRHVYLAQVIAGQRLPPRLSDPRPRDLDPLVARHHALYLRTYEPCAHQLDQQISRKTIREQKGFGTAVGDASSSSTRRRLPPDLARRLFGIWYGERMGRGGSQESSPRTQAVNRTLPRCQPQFGAPMRFFFA